MLGHVDLSSTVGTFRFSSVFKSLPSWLQWEAIVVLDDEEMGGEAAYDSSNACWSSVDRLFFLALFKYTDARFLTTAITSIHSPWANEIGAWEAGCHAKNIRRIIAGMEMSSSTDNSRFASDREIAEFCYSWYRGTTSDFIVRMESFLNDRSQRA